MLPGGERASFRQSCWLAAVRISDSRFLFRLCFCMYIPAFCWRRLGLVPGVIRIGSMNVMLPSEKQTITWYHGACMVPVTVPDALVFYYLRR